MKGECHTKSNLIKLIIIKLIILYEFREMSNWNFKTIISLISKLGSESCVTQVWHITCPWRWQWGWWHCYVGNSMMVPDLRCWCQKYYVGDFFRYVGDFLSISNRSPTSWIGHQLLKLVTNTFGLQHPSSTSMSPSVNIGYLDQIVLNISEFLVIKSISEKCYH